MSKDVLLEFSMSPFGKGESVSKYVSRSIDIIDKSGLAYKLNPMGTCIEGSWDEVMAVVKQCHDLMSLDCERISTAIKIDYRKGKSDRIESKLKSIEDKLGRKVNK
jgi:uncharacterized protein (TIGR00106 family)